MPDIFGREWSDYSHLLHLAELEDGERSVTQHLSARAARQGGPAHNFDALGSGWTRNRRLTDAESNAQAFGFQTNNQQAIQTVVEEVLYTYSRYPNLVAVNNMISEGALTFSFRVVDRAGRSERIENSGSNAPSAMAVMRNVPYAVEYYGIIPEWTFRDLRHAMFAGLPLSMETIEAGVEGAIDTMESILINGDGDQLQGMINYTGITPVSYGGTTIMAQTADETLKSLQQIVASIVNDTAEVFGGRIKEGLTLFLPIEQAGYLENTPRASTSDTSIWEYFSMHNVWTSYTGNPVMLRYLAELKGAGASNVDRMVVGFINDRISEFAVPIEPRVIHILEKEYGACAPIEHQNSGFLLKRGLGLRYYDSI